MKESDIIYENDDFWVYQCDYQYEVHGVGITHSKFDSAYPLTADGLSLAKARCDYLAKRRKS